LIVLGGFAGTGKTTFSRRLSSELGIARLSSDTIGRTISTSEGIKGSSVDAYWIAYDVLFGLCEEFLQTGISVILDVNMGWAFQWQHLDSIRERHQEVFFFPIILRCSKETCIERIQERYSEDSIHNIPPELYEKEPKHRRIWNFINQLDRPGIYRVDASRTQDEVYDEIKQLLNVSTMIAKND
jgi:predicted kinase